MSLGTCQVRRRKQAKHILLMLYKSLICSHLGYGLSVHESTSEATLRRPDVFQNKCLQMCLREFRLTRLARTELEATIPPLFNRR